MLRKKSQQHRRNAFAELRTVAGISERLCCWPFFCFVMRSLPRFPAVIICRAMRSPRRWYRCSSLSTTAQCRDVCLRLPRKNYRCSVPYSSVFFSRDDLMSSTTLPSDMTAFALLAIRMTFALLDNAPHTRTSPLPAQYTMTMLEDTVPVVRATAVRSLRALLGMVTSFPPSDSSIFLLYIFPALQVGKGKGFGFVSRSGNMHELCIDVFFVFLWGSSLRMERSVLWV